MTAQSLSARIFRCLATNGPMSNAALQDALGAHCGEIARECVRLRKMGLIVRTDGASGRGTRAIYERAA